MRSFFCFLTIVLSLSASAQLKPVKLKFGDIKPADFEPKFYDIDTAASAIVLADIGDSKFEGNNDGFFSLVFKHHKRIRILNKNGFDAASISVGIYNSGNSEERLDDLEAVTYNLENGKVVATKLDKGSIFKDKLNKYYTTKKFTFPNLKEGSIIEYRYTITSPFVQYLRSWDFQGGLPRLWSQYSVEIPSLLDYVLSQQGYHDYAINDAKTDYESYNIMIPSSTGRSEVTKWQGATYRNVWAVQDVPALKNEPFTTTIENHLQKIEFQLRAIRWPSGKVDHFMGDWMKFTRDLMNSEDFGASLNKNNGFFDNEVDKAINGAKEDQQKVYNIYTYVRDNFTCTDHSATWLTSPLKKIFQSKSGSVADINLLLTAMLKSKGFDASPVLLSTTGHGKASELYPLMTKFNYVICRVKIGDKYYTLDASREKLGFGKLPTNVYNGYGRVIADMPELVDLSPNSLKESKITSLFIINDEKSGGLLGSFSSTLGYYESFSVRNKLSKTSAEEFFKEIKKGYGFEIDITNAAADSLKLYEEPVGIRYDFSFKPDEDVIYLNPMFSEATKENLFKSAVRQYPVEMPFSIDEVYVLNMEVPKGYKIDELPKSARVKLNDDEGMFEYIISNAGDKIQFRSRILLNKAIFAKEDYETLRDFFAMIVKKHSEQVVLKKIQ